MPAYEEALAKYNAYLEELAKYEDELAEYDKASENFQKESDIHKEVTEYNQTIDLENLDIVAKNDALEDLDTNAAENIDEVSEVNKGVTVDEAIINVLKGYKDLQDQLKALQDQAAELDAHAGKDAEMSSDEYAEYLAAVEAYNDAVNAYNEAAEAYNAAVDVYNEAVQNYNDTKEDESDSSIGSGMQQGTSTTDWGNINTNSTAGHIDVKYQGAASKDVTTDDDGNKTYSDTVTEFTITGVYAKEGDTDYGLNFDNDGSGSQAAGVQELEKNAQYNEFSANHNMGYGNGWWGSWWPNWGGSNQGSSSSTPSLNLATGTVSFYVTLEDSEGKTHSIKVDLNANSVYAEGSYYKAQANDFLDNYRDKKGNGLPTVKIDGETYYDISGQSVFLISALTCDGMRQSGSNLTPDGLDLVLNLQTMINIHKAANAEKIGYVEYQLGKTAQEQLSDAPEAPEEVKEVENPGEKPEAPTFNEKEPDYVADPGEKPEAPTFNEKEPDYVADPGEKPEAPTFNEKEPDYVADPGEKPEAPTFNEKEPDYVADPGEKPEAPTFNEKEPDYVADPGDAPVDPGEFDKTEPEAPAPTERLEELGTLDKLTDKFIIVIPEPEPEPTPTPRPSTPSTPSVEYPVMVIEEEEVPLAAQPVIEIEDEAVPLADAPETGDASLLWGLISSLSAGGFFALKRKRKEN